MADPQTQTPRSNKPPVNNCAACMRIARRGSRVIAAVAVVSPMGKAHWRDADGYTFCGRDARRLGWGSDA